MAPRQEIDFCLLIPCYNNLPGLLTSLHSVVYPERYLILVLDDGSRETITREKILVGLTEEKPVVVLRNEENLGITKTLNKGLAWIQENTNARYIARLDCGDTCDGRRFSLQVSYMESNPGTGLIGSWCRFEEKSTKLGYAYTTPTEHRKIVKAMYLRNVFIHPTVMFRTALLSQTGFYPEEFDHAEDYAFFWKLLRVAEVHVIGTFLVLCEINKQGLSYGNKGKQLVARWKVVKIYGRSNMLKILSFMRLCLLFILPKGLTLWLKQLKKP